MFQDPQAWHEAPEYGNTGSPSRDTESPGISVPHHPKRVLLRIHVIIEAGQGTYALEHTALSSVPRSTLPNATTVSPTPCPGSPHAVLPWLAHLPPVLTFAVRGKTLYYRDGNGKSHSAKIILFVPA